MANGVASEVLLLPQAMLDEIGAREEARKLTGVLAHVTFLSSLAVVCHLPNLLCSCPENCSPRS